MGKGSREKGARYEREVADALNASRKGLTYKADAQDGHADVEHDRLYIQCKRRAKLAVARHLEEVVESEKEAGELHGFKKIPIVVMREDRGESMVLMRIGDFHDLWEDADYFRRGAQEQMGPMVGGDGR